MPVLRYRLRSRAAPSMARIGRAQLLTTRVVAYAGAYSLVGADADLSISADTILTAEAGAFALSGQSASLLLSRVLAAGAGSFDLSGQSADLGITLTIDAGAGNIDLSGQDASLLMSRVIVGAAGSFDLTGTDATFLLGKYISAGSGAFDITGQTSPLLLAHVLAAGAGSFDLSGAAANLLAGKSLVAGTGSFAVTGQAAALSRQLPLSAEAGSYALSGQSATLTYEELSGITVEGTSETTTSTGSGTESVSLPGTPAEDDVYIIAMSIDTAPGSYGSAAASAGWTALYTSPSNSPASLVLLKRMTSSPDSSVSIERDSSNQSSIVIVQVKGVDTTTALDAALVSADGGSGMPDAPSHTTATDGALRIATGHLDDDTVASSTISGWTVLASGAPDSSTMLAYKIAETAGADNPAAFSGAGDDAWYATHFSLRPA